MTSLPTARFEYEWPADLDETEENRAAFNESTMQDIRERLQNLKDNGGRAWAEVWYSGFPDRDPDTEETFDAVELLEDGTIVTLPPYVELLAAAEVES